MKKKAGQKVKPTDPNDQKGNDKSKEKARKEDRENTEENEVCQKHEFTPVVCILCNKTMSGIHSNYSNP